MRDSLARMEIPRCGCKVSWIEFEVLVGHDEKGRPLFEKLRWLGPACCHVAARWHETPMGSWAIMLRASSPSEYNEPARLGKPMLCLAKLARLAVMAARRRLKQALRHPWDLDPRDADLATRTRRDGAVEIVVDDEEGRKRVHHKIPRQLVGIARAMATGEQRARLICYTCRGFPYSIWEDGATDADWQCAVLRVRPEEIGREKQRDDDLDSL